MQSQDQQISPPPKPTSPSPQYDFIYTEGQKPKKGFKIRGLSMRPAYLILGGLVTLIVLIIVFSTVFGGKSTNSQELVGIMARAQEIIRISTLVDAQSKDSDTKGLAQTTLKSLTSDQAEIAAYLKTAGQKIDVKNLVIYQDKSTDVQLQTATQNNGLEIFYHTYLKENLAKYESSLKTIYASAPQKAKPILQEAYESTKTLLASPQIASNSAR